MALQGRGKIFQNFPTLKQNKFSLNILVSEVLLMLMTFCCALGPVLSVNECMCK